VKSSNAELSNTSEAVKKGRDVTKKKSGVGSNINKKG
jgi:hypothetical protein